MRDARTLSDSRLAAGPLWRCAWRAPLLTFVLLAPICGCVPQTLVGPTPHAERCPQSHVLVCEEQHDTPSLPRDKQLSDYRHCGCVQVRF